MNILTQISRLIIGVLFVYSGFVKLVDPIGSKIKFTEYFGADVLNLEFLIPYALPFAILLLIAETVLGIMLLVGYKPRFTVWSIFLLTLVFLFLTWYSFAYNKVTDCGCFGDALQISAGATFYKNVFFMALVLILIKGMKYIKPLISVKIATITSYSAIVISSFIIYYVLQHLPIIDFRAYSIGTDIKEGMKYKGDGKVPPIHDFMIETEEGDKLEEALTNDKTMLIAIYNIEKSKKDNFKKLSKKAKEAKEKGYKIYVLTASYIEDLKATQEKLGLPYTFGFCDETTLKTMVRANPGIITIEKGVIVGKWNGNDADDVKLK